MNAEDLETGERFIWNWQRGRASDFYRALIELIKIADTKNQQKIGFGYPEEMESYISYRLIPGWWDDLEARMEDAG